MATSVTPSPLPAAPGSAAASKIFLAVAVLLGVLATLLAFMFIRSENSGTPILITVAKRDLPANTTIDPSRDLKTMQYPPQYTTLRDNSLDPKALNAYKGTRLNRELFQNQPVMLADIAPFSAGDLVLEKPYMALTLPADTGMIIPGDYVKIILARPSLLGAVSTVPAAGMPQSDVIIVGNDPGFKVLAVGGSLFKTRQQTMASDQYSSAANKTVTLQVTEAQAKEIMNVLGSLNSANRVTLLLCPSAKTAPPETPAAEPPAAVTSRPATGTRP